MKSIILALLLIGGSLFSKGQSIALSDARLTTHTLSSGNVTIGISAAGGGYMNMVNLPGKGDIMDVATDMYGRGGQSAMRDQLRNGRYNPTQAGFNEPLGTPSEILAYPDSLIIEARPCALWHGDGQYDYIRWENIGADPYQGDGGNSDVDGIEEETLEGKQLTEVTSEFDYYGIYENYMGKKGVSIPCFRHYYEYRFIRPPGHCLSQFGQGTPAYNPNKLIGDISAQEPAGTFAATAEDISYLIKVWSLRNDISQWDPPYRHLINSQGEWVLQERDGDMPDGKVSGDDALYQPLVIIGESADPDSGLALGLYRPESEINTYVVAGINEADGRVAYRDDRRMEVRILEHPRRTGTMAKYGFYLKANGLLNRNRMDSGMYEMVRSEFYMLVGTPSEIFEAASRIHPFRYWTYEAVSEWDFLMDLEGWELTKSLSGSASNSILHLSITGTDPYMVSPDNLNIDADSAKYVLLKIRNGTNTTAGRFYWTTNTTTHFSIDHSKPINLQPNDPELSTYILDMGEESNWKETIKRVRLDPSNSANSGTVDIDYIKIVRDLTSSSQNMEADHPVKLYPNPASDRVAIETGLPSSIIIMDVMGRIVEVRERRAARHVIRTRGWSKGIYLARIINAAGVQTIPFMHD
jgi:hypothetical protein